MRRRRGFTLAAAMLLGLAAGAVAEEGQNEEPYIFSPCTATGDLCGQVSDVYAALHALAESDPSEGAAGFVAAMLELKPDTSGLYALHREALETPGAARLDANALLASAKVPQGPAMPVLVIPPLAAPRLVGLGDAAAAAPLGEAEAALAEADAALDALPVDPRSEVAALLLELSTLHLESLLVPEEPPLAPASSPAEHLAREDLPGGPADIAAPPLAAVHHEELRSEAFPTAAPALPGPQAPAARAAPGALAVAAAALEEPAVRDLIVAVAAMISVILLVPPLYHRLAQHQLLEHAARAHLYKLVAERPGIHIEELARLTGCSRSTVVYHLRLLARHGYVVTMGSRKSVHYYPNNGGADLVERERRALLTSPRARALAARIAAHQGIGRADLAALEGISVSTLSWHMGRLLRAGLVEDRLGSAGRELHPAPCLAEMLRPWASPVAPPSLPAMPPATEAAAPL